MGKRGGVSDRSHGVELHAPQARMDRNIMSTSPTCDASQLMPQLFEVMSTEESPQRLIGEQLILS